MAKVKSAICWRHVLNRYAMLYFITSNPNKVKEIKELIAGRIAIQHINYEYPELQLDTIEEVAMASANYIRRMKEVKTPFFIEDSGLLIHALNDFPGPFSAFVFRKIGNEGILRLMDGKTDRRAVFKTVIAFCQTADDEPRLFTGTVEGRITDNERGAGGFGYDPIFEYEGRTFAEMSTVEKNRVSHRGRAFMEFLRHCTGKVGCALYNKK